MTEPLVREPDKYYSQFMARQRLYKSKTVKYAQFGSESWKIVGNPGRRYSTTIQPKFTEPCNAQNYLLVSKNVLLYRHIGWFYLSLKSKF